MVKQLKPPTQPAMQRACAVARVLERMGDGWSFLVLRAAFLGETRFEGFMNTLQAPRAQVARALRRLREAGLIEHLCVGQGGPRYTLTTCGLDFYPVCIGLMDWGDRYAGPRGQPRSASPPLVLRWRGAAPGTPDIAPMWTCAACGQALEARDCDWHDGPGAGVAPRLPGRRRAADSRLYARAQPCSVASALEAVGDVWSFLILREAFFRVRHFDDFVPRLGVSRNVLAARLERLVEAGVLTREASSADARRREYRLAAAGLALYPTVVALMGWGDRWVSSPGNEPLQLVHRPCGGRLVARLVDRHTGKPLEANRIDAIARQDSDSAFRLSGKAAIASAPE